MNELIIPFACCYVMMSIWMISSVINRSAVAPGSLFSGLWFFTSFVPIVAMLVLGGEIDNTNSSYVLITIFVLLVFITSESVALNLCKKRSCWPRKILGNPIKRLFKFYLIFLLLGFFYPIILFIISQKYFASKNMLLIPGMISHAKYTETWAPPSFLNLFMMAIFISAIIAGFLSGVRKCNRIEKIILYVWIAPAMFSAYLNAARSAMALPIVLWLASYISGRAIVGSENGMKIKKLLPSITGIIVLAFIFVHGGYMVRTNVFDFENSKVFLGKSVSTLTGHMSVMGDWIQRGGLWSSEHKTIYTFAGTAQLFGIGERISGLYDENVIINYGGESSESNNIQPFGL